MAAILSARKSGQLEQKSEKRYHGVFLIEVSSTIFLPPISYRLVQVRLCVATLIGLTRVFQVLPSNSNLEHDP